MEQVKVLYDRKGHTLTVWLDDPLKEDVCKETGEEIVLMKDKSSRVIGFEKLNFTIPKGEELGVGFDAVG